MIQMVEHCTSIPNLALTQKSPMTFLQNTAVLFRLDPENVGIRQKNIRHVWRSLRPYLFQAKHLHGQLENVKNWLVATKALKLLTRF